jgi:hypothetical protein
MSGKLSDDQIKLHLTKLYNSLKHALELLRDIAEPLEKIVEHAERDEAKYPKEIGDSLYTLKTALQNAQALLIPLSVIDLALAEVVPDFEALAKLSS